MPTTKPKDFGYVSYGSPQGWFNLLSGGGRLGDSGGLSAYIDERALLPYGDWDALKGALGPGPLESGLFDRPIEDIRTVGDAEVAGGEFHIPTPTAEAEWLPADEEKEGDYRYVIDNVDTDWDEFYRQYEILNPPASRAYEAQVGQYEDPGPPPGEIEDPGLYDVEYDAQRGDFEDEDVAIDWGSVLSGAIDIAQGQVGQGAPSPYLTSFAGPVSSGGAVPETVTVNTRTGKVSPCRRRRRRRLLTCSDINDLAALKSLVGGGQAMTFAVMKAVRR